MSGFSHEVLGPVTDAELRATPVPVSGTVTATPSGTQDVNVVSTVEVEIKNDAGSPVPISGTVSTTPAAAATSTVTQVTSTGANQTLLASNASRKKAILYFNSGIWDIKFGATASATSRTLRVSTGSYLLEVDTWTGIIDAICTTAGKLVDVTELS